MTTMVAPALVPAVATLAGVVGGLLLEASSPWMVLGLVAAWSASVVSLLAKRPRFVVMAVCVGFVLAGWILGAATSRRLARAPIRTLISASDDRPSVVVEGRLVRDAAPTEYGASLTLAVDHATVGRRRWPVSGGLRVTVGGSFVHAHVDQWRAGRRLRLPVQVRRPPGYWNPGTPDQERVLNRRAIALLGSTKSALLVDLIESGDRVDEAAAAVRAAVRRRVRHAVRPWSTQSSDIIIALLIGDRTGLDPAVLDRLRAAGTYHVLAISGGNIAILVGLILAVTHLAGLPPRAGSLVTAVALVGYAAVVGRDASVVRATLVALAYLGARAVDHGSVALNAVALAALVIAAVDPSAIFDIGFTLSFGATLAIVLGVQRCAASLTRLALRTPLGRLPESWLAASLGLLAATICAEVALLPVSAFAFSRVSVAGLGLNFLAIPLMSVAQMAGLAVIILGLVHPALSAIPGFVGHVAAELLVRSASLVDLLPWLATRVPAPSIQVVITYYASLGVWFLAPVGRRVRLAAGLLASASLSTVVGGLSVPGLAPPAPMAPNGASTRGWLQVIALDVDQGDATFVRFPNGTTLLVDAGGAPGGLFDVGERVVLPALWKLGVRKLDYFAFTHGDPDHIGGAKVVIEQLRPTEVWEGIPVASSAPIATLRRRAADVGSRWRNLTDGVRIPVGGARVVVWHPQKPDWERPRVRNDDSLVLELGFGDASVLLTGDIGEDVERSLAATLPPAGIRILKMPHHGSRTSSSTSFLEALAPALVFGSAGRMNRFGHPAPEVLRRYERVGATIYRTDRDGAIWMATDGRRVVARSMTGRYVTRGVAVNSALTFDDRPLALHLVE